MKLKNKTALVAGATRGIGLSIARTLNAKGVRLILPWHEEGPVDIKKLRYEFGKSSRKHIFIKTDLRDPKDIKALTDNIAKETNSLEILVINIERGGMPIVHGSYEKKVNRDQWQLEMETTILAKRLLFENCLPLLKKAKEGTVINISSIAGITGRSGPAGLIFSDGYAAANRAISSFTETWARMGAPSVRVNELMLGIIDSRHGKGTRGWKTLSTKQKKQLTNHTLLGRTGTPDEVAELVLFLVNKGEYITGATIRMDGGFVLGGAEVPPMPDGILEKE